MTDPTRLIEQGLPLRAVSAEAAREKSQRHGHISTLHIWWARRPLVACRAAVAGALLPDPGKGKEQEALTDFIEDLCKWPGNDEKKAEKVERLVQQGRKMLREANGGAAPKVLDCFAGGGAIPFEAMRLGCEAYALDLNPVAVLLEYCTLVYPHRYGASSLVEDEQQPGLADERQASNRLAHDVERWGKWVGQQAEKKMAEFYPNDAKKATDVAYLWARTVPCPNLKCGAEIPLIRQTWLCNRPAKKVALRMTPDKKAKLARFKVVEDDHIDFDPKAGTMKLGSVLCPVCSEGSYTRFTLREAVAEKGFGKQPLAVVQSLAKGGKKYRPFTEKDLEAFEQARARLEAIRKEPDFNGLPTEPISRDYDWALLPPQYGLTRFCDLFNERQALVLMTFAATVMEAHERVLAETHDADYAKAVATYLALVLDRLADRCASLCRWDNSRETISNTFSRQALPMVWDYCEVNPFSGGSGDWDGALDWVVKVIEHCSNAAAESPASDVRQGTATNLPYKDQAFEAVITDPPYYDSVPYADLSDFFYVWLKRSVGPLYPELFGTLLTPKGEEIVQQSERYTSAPRRKKDKTFFEERMALTFKEMHRVLKPGGVCAVVFAHKTTTAWETLINALVKADFVVTASWPMHTEMAARLRAQDSAALASSVWLICRKRNPQAPVGSWKQVQAELQQEVQERMTFFLSEGIRGADALLSAIGPALKVYGRYSSVEKVTGEQVKVGEFLDRMREAVAHQALSSILEGQEMGSVDPTTAFYVLWKWSYEARDEAEAGPLGDADEGESQEEAADEENGNGKSKGGSTKVRLPADDAIMLARSLGVEFEELTRPGGVLLRDKEYAQLLGPVDRRNLKGLGQVREGLPPPVIDMLHRAVNEWASGNQAALDEYLDASGARTNEALWKVASALSRILPVESEEKRLVDGLWGRFGGGTEQPQKRGQTKLNKFPGGE